MLKHLALVALAVSPAWGIPALTSTITSTTSTSTTSTSTTSTSTTSTSTSASTSSTIAVASTSAAPGRCGSAKCSNQCARDLLESDLDSTSILSYCSTYFPDVWVTLDAETTWVTSVVETDVVTITSSSTTSTTAATVALVYRDDIEKRTAISTSATWAPHCSGDDQYSSACSCYGATQATSTYTPDPVTSTVSVTTTVTEVVVPTSNICQLYNKNFPYPQCCSGFSSGLGFTCVDPANYDTAADYSASCSSLNKHTYCCAGQNANTLSCTYYSVAY